MEKEEWKKYIASVRADYFSAKKVVCRALNKVSEHRISVIDHSTAYFWMLERVIDGKKIKVIIPLFVLENGLYG